MRTRATRLALSCAFVMASAALLALSPHAMLVLLPALVVAWMVTVGWFTGERAMAFLRRVVRRRRPARASLLPGAVRRARRAAVASCRLLVGSVASRPPPVLAP